MWGGMEMVGMIGGWNGDEIGDLYLVLLFLNSGTKKELVSGQAGRDKIRYLLVFRK